MAEKKRKPGLILAGIGVVIVALGLYLIPFFPMVSSLLGAKAIKLDTWPAYDADYRLAERDEPLTAEDVAYYVATKIPDIYKNEGFSIRNFQQFEAVCLMEKPGLDTLHNDKLYEETVVERECLALNIDIELDCAGDGFDAEEDPNTGFTVFGSSTNERMQAHAEELEYQIYHAIAESSDYPFREIGLTVSWDGQMLVSSTRYDMMVVDRKEYTKECPDYEIYVPDTE